MNKHSNVFEEKKAKLLREEEELRKALEQESEDVESSIVDFLKWFALTGLIAGAIFGIIKLIGGGKNNKTKEVKSEKPKKKKTENTFIRSLSEKLSDQVAAILTSFITGYLARMQENLKNKDTKD